MSNSLLTVIRENIPEVKGPSRAVLMALADRADNAGQCYPSLATIAKDAGVCVSTVKTALRKLRSAGFMTWTNTTTEAGDAGSNIYHITLEGRAGDAPPRAGDGQRRTAPAPQVGQDAPEGRAGDGYKASREAPRETSFALDGASSCPVPKIYWHAPDGFTGITDTDRQGWGEAFPAVNITRQLAAMGEWLKANPAKAKKSNWRKFITSWLSREQDKGGDIPSNPAGTSPPGTRIINGRAFKS